jgi:hypothetical protein
MSKKSKEYKVAMVEKPDGTKEVKYVLELVKMNQHKRRWLPANKRDFTRSLNNGSVTCK